MDNQLHLLPHDTKRHIRDLYKELEDTMAQLNFDVYDELAINDVCNKLNEILRKQQKEKGKREKYVL